MMYNAIRKTLVEEDVYNVSTTENGAKGYGTTGMSLLDMHFAIGSYRDRPEGTIVMDFLKAYVEDRDLALKWLFHIRDIREGLGERRLFRVVMKHMAIHQPSEINHLLELVAEYGRWDDLLELLDTSLSTQVSDILRNQLKEDKRNMSQEKPISLLAKWMPSINASSNKSKWAGKLLAKRLKMNDQEYRKMLSSLRRYIDVIERRMSLGDWEGIEYGKVPSRANLIYQRAFMKHDNARRQKYLEALSKGEEKINAGTLFPHDIVHRYMDAYQLRRLESLNLTLEELWKALPNTIDAASKTIVVADGSGSMTSTLGKSEVTALSVANALAIYFAERLSGDFKDKYISFSTNPKLVDLRGAKTLREKIKIALAHNEVCSTNIEGVFKLLLDTAKHNHMSQEDMPSNILIISDMEFNEAVDGSDEKLFKIIAREWDNAGYKLPRLVFWNVDSRTNTIPITQNELGVALVSGFSVNVANMVMSTQLDPWICLLDVLMSERYAPIKAA